MELNFLMTVTYSWDTAYIAVPCKDYCEALSWLLQYLNAEIDRVKSEHEYSPMVLEDHDDKILVYATKQQYKADKESDYHEYNHIRYKIFKPGRGHYLGRNEP